MLKLAVLGRGAWGSALARLAQNNDHQVQMWSRRGDLSLEDAIADADVILSAISMKGVASLAQRLCQMSIPPKAILVTATKGLDPATA